MTPVEIVARAMRGQWDDPVVALEALHAAGWRIVRTTETSCYDPPEGFEPAIDDPKDWDRSGVFYEDEDRPEGCVPLHAIAEEWTPDRAATPSTDGLTAKQHEVLTAIATLTQRYGYPPTVRELGEAVGLSSASTVHAHLTSLERKGFIRRDPTKPRALVVETAQ